MIRITDAALASIYTALGENPPEQGGALFGPPDGDVITTFIHDVEADVTSVVYHNSARLIGQIAEHEGTTGDLFKGIIHSHPSRSWRPSGQDRTEYARTLAANPSMGSYLAPIVTHDISMPPRRNELIYGDSRFSFFSAHRSGQAQALLIEEPIVVIPVQSAWDALGDRTLSPLVRISVAGESMLGGEITISGVGRTLLLLPISFPASPPIALAGRDNASLALDWDLELEPAQRLVAAVHKVEVRASRERPDLPEDRPRTWGRGLLRRRNGPARGVYSLRPLPSKPAGRTDFQSEDLFARSAGLVSQTLRGKHVLIVGAGSVGSYLAEILARSGVGRLTIIDPDRVSPHNIGRSLFSTSDIGTAKTDAVSARIRAAVEVTEVTPIVGTLADLADETLRTLFDEADVVVGVTDSNQAQLELAHFAYWHGRAAIFSGLYAMAAGGEVIVSEPGGPCWDCSLAGARHGETLNTIARSSTDYGTGRMIAQPGLLADIHHVATMAAKLILGALEDDPQAATFLLYRRAVNERRYFVQTTMTSDSTLIEDVFGAVPGQLAYQTVWLTAMERNPNCAICGEISGRSDPYSFRNEAVSVSALRAKIPARAGESVGDIGSTR